jgi:hypothetical protein
MFILSRGANEPGELETFRILTCLGLTMFYERERT